MAQRASRIVLVLAVVAFSVVGENAEANETPSLSKALGNLLLASGSSSSQAFRLGLATRPVNTRASRPAMQEAGDATMKYSNTAQQAARAELDEEDEEEDEDWFDEDRIKKEEAEEGRRFLKAIPDDAVAGNMEQFMYKGGIAQVIDQLDYDLVGLQSVKNEVRSFAYMLVVDKMRMKLGLNCEVPSLHFSFTGAPGTGKTTVALRLGGILQRMGYCRRGHVVLATRDLLIGQYVGHTGPKTKQLIEKAMGGICFIDEAYNLYVPGNPKDYGWESLQIIQHMMDSHKDDVIFVFAGYKDLIDRMFREAAPGLAHQIGNHIHFPNYTPDECVEIARVMARDQGRILMPCAIEALKQYFVEKVNMPFFSNARTVRVALQTSTLHQANRLIAAMSESSDELTQAEVDEIYGVDIPHVMDDQDGINEDGSFTKAGEEYMRRYQYDEMMKAMPKPPMTVMSHEQILGLLNAADNDDMEVATGPGSHVQQGYRGKRDGR